MKSIKQFFCIIVFILIGVSSYSQNCKNLILNTDEYTGKKTKTTKTLIFKKFPFENVFFQIDEISDSLKLTFIYNNSDKDFASKGNFSCKKGDSLIIQLEDGSVLKLDLLGQNYFSHIETKEPKVKIQLGDADLTKSGKVIFEPVYKLNSSDIEILGNIKIAKIRVEASGAKSNTIQKINSIELVILDKQADQFKTDLNCISK